MTVRVFHTQVDLTVALPRHRLKALTQLQESFRLTCICVYVKKDSLGPVVGKERAQLRHLRHQLAHPQKNPWAESHFLHHKYLRPPQTKQQQSENAFAMTLKLQCVEMMDLHIKILAGPFVLGCLNFERGGAQPLQHSPQLHLLRERPRRLIPSILHPPQLQTRLHNVAAAMFPNLCAVRTMLHTGIPVGHGAIISFPFVPVRALPRRPQLDQQPPLRMQYARQIPVLMKDYAIQWMARQVHSNQVNCKARMILAVVLVMYRHVLGVSAKKASEEPTVRGNRQQLGSFRQPRHRSPRRQISLLPSQPQE